MRVVLDTNVLVRSTPASRGGPAWETLQCVVGTHRLLISPPLLLELADVLNRPRLRAALALGESEVAPFVVNIRQIAVLVPLPSNMPAYVPDDPKDSAVVQTAILGKADVICTLDNHLFHPQVLAICRAHGIRLLSDVDLLNELRQGPQP